MIYDDGGRKRTKKPTKICRDLTIRRVLRQDVGGHRGVGARTGGSRHSARCRDDASMLQGASVISMRVEWKIEALEAGALRSRTQQLH